MPLLGLFSRKSKPISPNTAQSSSSKDSTSQDDLESADTDYVLSPTSANVPSMANGLFKYNHSNASQASSASTSKLRHVFRRKQSIPTTSPLKHPSDSSVPRSSMTTSRVNGNSIDLSTLGPPPTRASLFSGDRSRSSQSLPDADRRRPSASPHQAPGRGKDTEKSASPLFSWAHRERTKSKPSAPEPQNHSLPPLPPLSDSFNLKSFRHVRPDSPSNTPGERPQSPPTSFATPPTRPRGNSVTSDSSQRISVAAFREAQARRSSTNLVNPSPSPSLRPISLADTIRTETPPPRPPRTVQPQSSPAPAQRKPTAVPASSSSSSESSPEEEESDSEGYSPSRTRPGLGRKRTITQHSSRAKSELGHGSSSHGHTSHHRQTASTRSDIGHGSPRGSRDSPPPPPPSSYQNPPVSTSVGTRSFSIHGRSRASHSTSDLNPNAAAKRASVLIAANAQNSVRNPQNPRSPGSDTSESDSNGHSSDEDDAPLATLMNPKRPDTSMSNVSGTTARSRTLSKPLIDLSAKSNPLTGKPAIDTRNQGTESPRDRLISPTNINNRLAQLATGLNGYRSAGSKSEDSLLPGVTSPTAIDNSVRLVTRTPLKGNDNARPISPDMHSPSSFMFISKMDEPFVPPRISPKMSPPVSPRGRRSSPQSIDGGRPTSPSMKSPTASMLMSKTDEHTSAPNASPDVSFPTASSGREQSVSGSPERPIPVKGRANTDNGFRVVSRPSRSRTEPQPIPAVTTPPSTYTDSVSKPPQINPTPVRHRPTASSFSVTSRPLSGQSENGDISAPVSSRDSISPSKPASPPLSRPPSMSLSSLVTPTNSHPPKRPFANNRGRDRDSPASSTGGSSSGKAPLTPGDGSDYFSSGVHGQSYSPSVSASGISSTQSAMKGARGHIKRASVSFQDYGHGQEPERERGRAGSSMANGVGPQPSPEERENRRRDRRRSEAKASIELGNVVNGRGPIDDDDSDEDVPIGSGMGPRMNMMNPMMNPAMAMGAMNYPANMSANWDAWQRSQSTSSMLSPQQYLSPQPPMSADASFLAAHQHAMMIAKQAYQYAVAQQAMAAAADEWERGSNVGGFNGGFGGSQMGMSVQGGWNPGANMFPQGPRSMYAGSSYGGQSDAGTGWGTASVFGDSFGPSTGGADRRSQMLAFQRSESSGNLGVPTPVRPGPRARTKTAPSNAPLPTQHSAFGGRKNNPPPPSSWKVGQ